jgi:hypothetical protein
MKKTNRRLLLKRVSVQSLTRPQGAAPEGGWWNNDRSYDEGCSGSCHSCEGCGGWEIESVNVC